MDPAVTTPEFVLDENSLNKVIEAILTKMKERGSVLSRAEDASIWDKIVTGVINGTLGADVQDAGAKGVPIELLAEMVLKGQFLKYKLVVSDKGIETVVTTPEEGVVYLLKPTTSNKAAVWMYMSDASSSKYWLEIAGVEIPELGMVDTENEDEVTNIITHVKNADKDYSESQNVQASDLVTAQALTNVLIGLGYWRKIIVKYEKHQGTPIAEYYPKPATDALYVYQVSEDDQDWALYVAVKQNGKYAWLKLAGDEQPIEIDLSNYWSKDELKILTEQKAEEIFNNAVNSVFGD